MAFLLVEDDIDLATAIIDYLELEGMPCDHAINGLSGLNLIQNNCYDCVILDLNLPKMDGLAVTEQLRSEGIDVPILMLTARDTLDDKLVGFNKGADDYLVKPFAMEELIARVMVLSRRRSGEVKRLSVCGLTLDTQQQTIYKANRPLKLSPTAFKILQSLMRASPSVVSKQQLIQQVWGDELPDTNNLKVHIFNLRKEVNKDTDENLIHTLKGHGFVLKKEDN